MGCSGGGFVKSCIDDGCLAVGIEGSDFSQRLKRAEWATLDQHFLFTADITKPFQVNAYVKEKKVPLKFDVVTAWEVLEHIEEKDLPALFSNIKKHLLPGGLAIFSVCARDAWFMGVNLHRTTQLKEWWIKKTDEEGFLHHPELIPYFSPHFVRGPRRQKPLAFHLILSLKGFPPPKPPKKTLKQYLYGRWVGCYLQKSLKKLLV